MQPRRDDGHVCQTTGVIARVDVASRELTVFVYGITHVFDVPPSCSIFLHGEAVKLRLLLPGDYVQIAYRQTGNGLVASLIQVNWWLPVTEEKRERVETVVGLRRPTHLEQSEEREKASADSTGEFVAHSIHVVSQPGQGRRRRPDRCGRCPRERTASPWRQGDHAMICNEIVPFPGTDSFDDQLDEDAEMTAAGITRAARMTRGHGVLIVDDDPMVRTVLSRTLRDDGFAVWPAADGYQALKTYIKYCDEIDFALIDVRMPEFDGPQTLSALQQVNPHLRFCFMTGDPGRYTEDQLMARGADGILHKPFRAEDLAQVMQKATQDKTPGSGDWDRGAPAPEIVEVCTDWQVIANDRR
jgi:two-component system response regulator (stage 0 sporulation protein F)